MCECFYPETSTGYARDFLLEEFDDTMNWHWREIPICDSDTSRQCLRLPWQRLSIPQYAAKTQVRNAVSNLEACDVPPFAAFGSPACPKQKCILQLGSWQL